MSDINFELIAEQMKIPRLEIIRGEKKAMGAHIPTGVFSYKDSKTSIMSYVDTGVFVLFRGSYAGSSVEKKYKQYIDKDQKTICEIIFQSRNAAAQFVLGKTGRTDSWKIQPQNE